jgi:two-component system phosphate regulon sensor histidine kinase PhoR
MRLAQMQSEFVASVSHALKTPLAKIQLFAETLESGRVSSPDRAMLYQRRIGIQARKLGQLIGALLDFNKFEAGAGRYPLEEVDLRSVLRSAIEPFEDELAQEGYRTDIVLPEERVSVLANGEALQHLFRNLIGNAIKYSPDERFLRIAVSTADGYALTEVTDHGIGIPRREQPKIFRKFYRGGRAVAMAISGSGIGLAIVNHVARVHNGRVSVTSVPGQGSTFKVRLKIIAESPAVQG